MVHEQLLQTSFTVQGNISFVIIYYKHWFYKFYGAMVVIVWSLDLLLPMQSVPITTDVVSSNLDQGEVYNIM